MNSYVDKNNTPVRSGHIIFYNENKEGAGYHYGAGLELVVEKDNDLHYKTLFYNSSGGWLAAPEDTETSSLKYGSVDFFKAKLVDAVLADSEIIGHIDHNADMLKIEWLEANYPFYVNERVGGEE